jgi:hypothetical protein
MSSIRKREACCFMSIYLKEYSSSKLSVLIVNERLDSECKLNIVECHREYIYI